jgi:ribonuclease HI
MTGRIFNPKWCNWDDPPRDPHETLSYSPSDQLTFLNRTAGGWRTVERTMVCISIDGACSNNGCFDARAASAVHFGPGSSYNWACKLDPNQQPQTSQYAELFAAVRAVRICDRNRANSPSVWDDVQLIVIITDSDFLFRSITENVYKWELNGYINAKGLPVIHEGTFRLLNATVEALEDEGINVTFWKVPREYNQDADALAANEL